MGEGYTRGIVGLLSSILFGCCCGCICFNLSFFGTLILFHIGSPIVFTLEALVVGIVVFIITGLIGVLCAALMTGGINFDVMSHQEDSLEVGHIAIGGGVGLGCGFVFFFFFIICQPLFCIICFGSLFFLGFYKSGFLKKKIDYSKPQFDVTNEEETLEAIEDSYENFVKLPSDMQDDNDFILKALKANGEVFQCIPKEKLTREMIVEASKTYYGLIMSYEEYRNDREVCENQVQASWNNVGYVSEELRSDKDFMMKAVAVGGFAIEYAKGDIVNDLDVAMEAVKNRGDCLKVISEELKNSSRELNLTAVKHPFINGYCAYEYIPEELKDDKEITIEAVSNQGHGIKYASERLKNDRDVIIAALSQNGGCLEYLDEKFKMDKDICLIAVKQGSEAWCHVHKDLKKDEDLLNAQRTWDEYVGEYDSDDSCE